MRTLPDNPSAAYLRREAKDLLAALRESTPGATLSAAQKLLAGQYGYRGWTEMKAEVDRRRANVRPGDPALAERIASEFGLGAVTGGLTPIAYGLMGRSWQLETGAGRFTAGTVFDWITEASSQSSMRLRDAAADAGVLSPKPVRAPSGNYLVSIDGANWRVDEWIDCGPSQTRPVRSSIAGKVGEVLATLHGLAIPADAVIGWYAHRRPVDEFASLVDRARAAGVDWLPDLERAMPKWLELHEIALPSPSSEPILCHGDITPECVRTAKGDGIVVLHWDFAGGGVPEWEIATTLTQFAGFESRLVSERAARALADGYRRVAGSMPSLGVPSFAATITGALNYVYGQVCGALEGPGERGAEQYTRYMRETREALADPLSIETIERIVKAASGA